MVRINLRRPQGLRPWGAALLWAYATSVLAIGPSAGPVRFVPDNLYGVDFVDAAHGLATGYYGTVLRTRDGGRNWSVGSVGTTELLRRVRLLTPTEAWAVGHRGSVFSTTDGGASWSMRHRLPGVYLRDLSFVDSRHGWVVGHDQTILGTRDGGASWTGQKISGYRRRDPARLHGVVALDAERALTVGEFGVVAETRDGGATWELLPNPADTTLTAVASDGVRAVAVGLDGSALEISLDPATEPRVSVLATGVSEHLLDIGFLPTGGDAYAVGRSVLLRLHGGTFAPIPAAPSVQVAYGWYAGVDVAPDGTVWAVGDTGTVLAMNASATAPRFDVAFRLGTASPGTASPTEDADGAR